MQTFGQFNICRHFIGFWEVSRILEPADAPEYGRIIARALLLIADGKQLDEFSDFAIPGFFPTSLQYRYSPDQYLLKPI
jgi:hypothetical protein